MENYLNIDTGEIELGEPLLKRNQKGASIPIKTGSPSVIAGDDGQTQAGRLIDFYTLDFISPFGNNVRFTNDKGGLYSDNSDGSTPDYVIDNATGLGYKMAFEPDNTIINHLANAQNLLVGAYSGFRVANINEYMAIKSPTSFFAELSIFGNPSFNEMLVNNFRDVNNCLRMYKGTTLSYVLTTLNRMVIMVRNHTY